MKSIQVVFSVLLVVMSFQLSGQDMVKDYAFVQLNQQDRLRVDEEKNLASIKTKLPEIRDLLLNKINYPTTMLMYNIKGTSKVSVGITTEGKIVDIDIIESLGTAFDIEIKSALRKINIGSVAIEGGKTKQTIIFPIQFEI